MASVEAFPEGESYQTDRVLEHIYISDDEEPDPAALDEPELVELEYEADELDLSIEDGYTTDGLHLFLNQAGKHKILTQFEEYQFNRRSEKAKPAQMLKDGEDPTRLTKKERTDRGIDDRDLDVYRTLKSMNLTDERLDAIIEDGNDAKRKMQEHNLKLVVSIAKHHRHPNMTYLDLIQEGMLGLIRASEKFDWRKGYKFSTYATWWIRQAVQRGIANQGRTIRVPVHVVERIQKISRAERQLTARLGRDPTREEIAEQTELPLHQIIEALDAASVTASLDRPVGEDEDGLYGDLVASQDQETEDEALDNMRNVDLRASLEQLSERERRILEMRFGFHEQPPKSLEDIGRHFGITRERVRQVETEALRKLADMKDMSGYDESAAKSIPNRQRYKKVL